MIETDELLRRPRDPGSVVAAQLARAGIRVRYRQLALVARREQRRERHAAPCSAARSQIL